jgi:hypothetical protein
MILSFIIIIDEVVHQYIDLELLIAKDNKNKFKY